MPNFGWLPFLQCRQILAGRLADPNNIYWTDQELKYYIWEALRTFNALTEIWNQPFAFTATNAGTWYDTSQMNGSPRLATVVDADLYTIMEYHLIEPPTGAGTWTGTTQFQLSDLQGALQRRVDEIIQYAGTNIQNLPFLASAHSRRALVFPDSTLEPRRVRFFPNSGYGFPVTLGREDTLAFDRFSPQWTQTPDSTPGHWSVITGPPLELEVDVAPSAPADYDIIALECNTPFSPPASTAISIPNDWTWLAKWGALADLLGRESEATDRQRAEYCLNRYSQGLEVMKQSNWLVSGTIAGSPADTVPLVEMDAFSPEWQNNAIAWPTLVIAGMDFLGVCPTPLTTVGVSLILVGNAPLPVMDTDLVQVSRDVLDVVLGYAQVLSCFKMGGEDFTSTADLEKDFYRLCVSQNKRLLQMGIFGDTVHSEGKRQDIARPRE